MTPENFVDILFEKVFDLPRVYANVEKAKPELIDWLEKNPRLLKVYPSRVTNFLLQTCIELTKKKTTREIIANTYLTESIMFAILSCQFDMPLLKKYAKVFINTLKDTAHYTIEYKKPAKYSRTVRVVPTMPIEFFWIIPIFSNPLIITKIDFHDYIVECLNLTKSVEGFKDGYQYYVDLVTTYDKTSFKTFMRESVMMSRAN
jgi:hypothetical protein